MTAPWNVREAFTVVADGATLEARALGPAPHEAPTIVLLHEGLGSAGLWRDFPNRLQAATGLGVFAYSRRGYGRSDRAELPRPLDYLTREAVDVLPGVLDAIRLRHGILVGHSDGATIAALHGAHVNDPRIGGLVLMAPHFFTEPLSLAEIAQTRDAFKSSGLRERLARHHDDADRTFHGWSDAWLDPAFHAWNIVEAIERIRVPVLAIQGRQDQYGTLAQIDVIGERLDAPFERLVLEDCGHAPFIEKADETLAAVTAFVGRVESGRGRGEP